MAAGERITERLLLPLQRQMRELPLAGRQKAGMRRKKTDSNELGILRASGELNAPTFGGAF